MTNRELAMEYLKRFCAGDIDGLEPLLTADLRFTGTLHTYSSAAEYLDGLRRDPPQECGCRVLSVSEGADTVAVFYEYRKADHTLRIAQLFRIANRRIHEMLLVFDGRDTATQGSNG